MGRHRPVSDADWNQLITLASGYLALESGDIQAAMQRALGAHMDLIAALKSEQIVATIPEGTVTMFVPEQGGVALRLAGEDPPKSPFAPDPSDAPAPPALPGNAPDPAAAASDTVRIQDEDGGITEISAPPQLDVETPPTAPDPSLEKTLAEGPTESADDEDPLEGDGSRTFTFEEDEA